MQYLFLEVQMKRYADELAIIINPFLERVLKNGRLVLESCDVCPLECFWEYINSIPGVSFSESTAQLLGSHLSLNRAGVRDAYPKAYEVLKRLVVFSSLSTLLQGTMSFVAREITGELISVFNTLNVRVLMHTMSLTLHHPLIPEEISELCQIADEFLLEIIDT